MGGNIITRFLTESGSNYAVVTTPGVGVTVTRHSDHGIYGADIPLVAEPVRRFSATNGAGATIVLESGLLIRTSKVKWLFTETV